MVYNDFFHDIREGIVLARNWLESNVVDVKQFNSKRKDGQEKRPQNYPKSVSYRSIANFLSKNGKAVSYVTVKNYLDISEIKGLFNMVF